MGAGRTQLARTLFGAEKIQHGQVYINGEEVELKSPKDAILAGIGLVTEDRKTEGLILELSVKQNISMPGIDKFVNFGILNLKKESRVADEYIRKRNMKTPTRDQPSTDQR